MSMMPFTIALLVANRSLWEPAHACFQNLPVRVALEQTEAENVDALLDRIELHRVDVVLLEASLLAVPLHDFTRRLRETSSQPVVFVLHPEASTQHIMEAIHAGAAEFLYLPLADTLRQAFERLAAGRAHSSASGAGGLGRAIGFLSAKGGCGATTFAAHAAVDLARQTREPVLLGDFDFEAGLLRFLLKVRTTYSVRDALDNMHRMDSNYWKALISTYGGLVDVLPAPDDVAARRPGGTEETAQLVRFVRSTYPFAVIDYGRNYSSSALDSLGELETLFIVTTLEPDALEQTRECLRSIATREHSSRVRVLLNRVPERGSHDKDKKGVESFLGTALAGAFTNDPEALYEAWSAGRLLDGGSKLGKEIHALAQSLVASARGVQVPAPSVVFQAVPAGRRWFSFLRGAQA